MATTCSRTGTCHGCSFRAHSGVLIPEGGLGGYHAFYDNTIMVGETKTALKKGGEIVDAGSDIYGETGAEQHASSRSVSEAGRSTNHMIPFICRSRVSVHWCRSLT